MDGEANGWVLLNQTEKRIVGILVALFEHMLEIAGGLMCVNDQDQMKV